MAVTKKADLFIPEVVADKMATDYGNAIVVSSYFEADDELVGRAGDTLTVPQYNYIGDAEGLAEGEDGTPVKLTETTTTCTVEKVAKHVSLTDEALNSGHGDPYGEASTQIAKSVAIKDDKDAIACLLTATQTATGASLDVAITNGLKVFGEKALTNTVYAFVNSANYYDMLQAKTFIPASQMLAEKVTKGVVGEYMGVIVVPTDTVTANSPILMMAGAGRKINKAYFEAEKDRDIINFTNILSGVEHRGFYLYRPTYVVKLTIGA